MIAIVIPVHKRKSELVRLLQSLNAIDTPGHEIVLVNNSSEKMDYINDKSIKILDMGYNRGATAGFNAGLEYVMKSSKYSYVWLMDSDIEVESDTLTKLHNVMEEDLSIGIAGPKILNSQNRELIVEVGANVDLGSGNILPVRCNEVNSGETGINDVDYLGSGISLIRVKALREVGLMNENYYFLWDDIDFCLRTGKKGYRLVAVEDAVVYHPPFTEKRNPKSGVYYGIRNMLMLVSIHGSVMDILSFNFVSLRKNLKNIFFALFNGNFQFEKFMYFAYRDFVLNRLGEGNYEFNIPEKKERKEDFVFSGNERVLVFSNVFADRVFEVSRKIKSMHPGISLFLLCRENRKNIFNDTVFEEVITFNDNHQHLFQYLKLYSRLRKYSFDIAVNPEPDISPPYQNIFKKVVGWNGDPGFFLSSDEKKKNIWKLPVTFLAGEITALLLLPFLVATSLNYRLKSLKNI